jgi:hypothetical protein
MLTFSLILFLFNCITVPRQDNGSDCGVFVCRYALAIFKLRHLKFTDKDAGIEKGSDLIQEPFSELITNGKEFDFDCDDIRRIRAEYQNFIRNLHPLYDQFNKMKLKKEREDKKARKELKRKRKVETTANNTEPPSSESQEGRLEEQGDNDGEIDLRT